MDGWSGASSSASGLKYAGPEMMEVGVATAGPDPPRPSPPDRHSFFGGVGFFLWTLWGPYRSFRLAYSFVLRTDPPGFSVCLPLVHSMPLLNAQQRDLPAGVVHK